MYRGHSRYVDRFCMCLFYLPHLVAGVTAQYAASGDITGLLGERRRLRLDSPGNIDTVRVS
jgi:hypothetical protein